MTFQAETRAQWRQWLADHHATAKSVWLVTFKKNSGHPHLPYADAVEEALCFGWVDSKPGKVDAQRSQLYFAPRNPRSRWSGLNKQRVERLTAAGLMQPAGLKMVALAKQSGTWDALNEVESLTVPPDLQTLLDQTPPAAQNFAAFPPSARRGILEWLLAAKRPETRQRRLADIVEKAARGERANQFRRP